MSKKERALLKRLRDEFKALRKRTASLEKQQQARATGVADTPWQAVSKNGLMTVGRPIPKAAKQ